MSIRNTDKLLVGRGDSSYYVTLENSGLGNDIPLSGTLPGKPITGDVDLGAGVNVNIAGDGAGINIQAGYWGALKYDGDLQFEWGGSGIKTGADINMKAGNVGFDEAASENQYANVGGNWGEIFRGHGIHWLKAPEHKYDAANKEYVDDAISSGVGAIDTTLFVPAVGGATMQGPLAMQAIDPTNGRATNKINTLGIYSNSSSSALRLGTTRDRMYVGHNDVSINGPLKVGEIQEKNDGDGVTISSHFKVGQIRMEPGGYIGSDSNPRLTFNNANDAVDGAGLLVVPRPADNRRSFAIRGNDDAGTEKDMLYTYTNPSGTPDAVNYVGKMDNDYNLVNKAYVDDTKMPKNINTLPLLST